jgi:hypothetical protein
MTESKYPVMAESMTELMKKINTELEELVEMMGMMKEADGTLFLNMCVTIRFFENFKKLKALVVAKEDRPTIPLAELTNRIHDLNEEILKVCVILQEQNNRKEQS